MSYIAVEHIASESVTPITSYDATKWNLGTLIKQRTDSSPNYIAPIQTTVARPVEQSAAIPGIYPFTVSWSSTIDWVFLADNAAAAATRRIQLYTFNKSTSTFGWVGFVTLTYPAATVGHTIRALELTYDPYFVGTISGSSTNIIGTSTLWQTNRMCVGCRIGFGSTGATTISTWYSIATIGGEGTMTISPALPTTLPAGTTYVIEDLRIITPTTNTTTTNGGLFITKGLSYNSFTPGGSTIPAATSTDNISAVYWLADASTVTDVVASGGEADVRTSWIAQDYYVLDSPSAGNYKVYKYNIRKALTLSSGKDTTTLIAATGIQPVTGTISQINNLTLQTINHGPLAGVKALYFLTTTRIYAARTTNIINTLITWIDYTMTEIPTGSVNTFAATGALNTITYSSVMDRFIITSGGAAGVRSYVCSFNTIGNPMENIFLIDDKQIAQSTADAGIVPHPSILVIGQTIFEQNGILYIAGIGTSAQTNLLFAVPIAADWQYGYTTNQRLISPKFLTPNCNKYIRSYTTNKSYLGSVNLGKTLDTFRVYARTSGIDDNSGAWILLPDGNDLSTFNTSTQIQYMYEFKTISDLCLPSRIYSSGVVYDALVTDSHYQPSANFTDFNNKKFAWRFSTGFGGTVPTLRVRLYDAVLGTLLLDDNSATPSGTWEKTLNSGGLWSSYNTSDKINETTYIRYTPASLGSNIVVKELLTLY